MHPGFPTLNLILLFLSYPQVFIYSKCIHSLFSFNKILFGRKLYQLLQSYTSSSFRSIDGKQNRH